MSACGDYTWGVSRYADAGLSQTSGWLQKHVKTDAGAGKQRALTSLLSVSLQRGAQAVVLGLCAASIPRLAHCPATTLRGPPSNVSGGEGERACTMTPWSACLQRLRATDRCEAAESVTRFIDCQIVDCSAWTAVVGRAPDETRGALDVGSRGCEDFYARQGAGSGAGRRKRWSYGEAV